MGTPVENIKAEEYTPLTRVAYRGVSPGEVIWLENNKFSRAANPSQGNEDPHWKALYTSDNGNVASRNITDNPGGVIKIEYPTDWRVLEVSAVAAGKNWHGDMELSWPVWRAVKSWAAAHNVEFPEVTEVNLDSHPLLDRLGENKIILKKPIGIDDSDSYEIIIPWALAEKIERSSIDTTSGKFFSSGDLDATNKPKDFKAQQRIWDKWGEYTCEAGGTFRATFSTSLCGFNVKSLQPKIRQVIEGVLNDPEFQDLKNRTGGAQTDKSKIEATYDRLEPKVRALSGIKSTVSPAIRGAGAALWAKGVADAFTDENVDTLEKAAAITAIVPGLGELVGVANGVDKRDPEGIIINSISMAALLASTAVPLLAPINGALAAGLAAAQGVATALDYLEIGLPEKAPLPVQAARTHKGVTAGWVDDARIIAHRPRPGMRQHVFSVSIDASKPEYTAPLIEVAGVRWDGRLDPIPDWIRIHQRNYPVPFQFEKLAGDSPYAFRCVLLRPTTITRTEPVYVTFAYMTSEFTCRTGEPDPNKACFPNDPAVAVRFGPMVQNEDERSVLSVAWTGPEMRPATNWIKLPYSIHPY
ncbi:hypothetical protein [Streptomyces syringium]|uniref:hypothetical protein n=1 Tax=Streptomyces syringium TaxID=76729 RepID=UPI00345529F1